MKENHVVNLARLPKEAFLKRDVFGRTLLHVAVLANDVGCFRELLRSPDARHGLLATDYESGWNILHYIFHYKRLTCLNVLLDYVELGASMNATMLAELLKRKDRCGLPPLVLLQNDVKDMVWIPHYINEKNEYHLQRQFPESRNDTETSATFSLRLIEHDWWVDSRGGLNIYVFGSNSNNQLGVGDSTDRSVPSRVSTQEFHTPVLENTDLREILQKPRFKEVKLSKYHSVVITADGRLFTSGMGSRGRLGHGTVLNLFQFKPVEPFGNSESAQSERVRKVATSNNHNLVLTDSNNIYAWGLNSLNQLGFTSVIPQSFKSTSEVYENSPKQVITGDLKRNSQRIIGIEISKIHSVAYTKNSVLFWGLNIGQMGLPISELLPSKDSEHRVNGVNYRGEIIPQPKERQMLYEIKLVASCETCTCIVATTNDIYIHYLGQSVKLPKLPARAFSEAHFDCFKPSRLTSAPVIKKVILKSHENIHILLENGNVMGFSLSSEDTKSLRNVKYSYIWRAYDSDMRAVDIDNSYDGSIIICTKNGSVFVTTSQGSLQRKGSMNTLSMPTLSTKKKFKKVEHVNRIVRVSCDESFSSFAMIRDDIDMLPLKLQKNDFLPDLEYLSVLMEQDLYRKQDQLLDIDHDGNSYITDYLFPAPPTSVESDTSILMGCLVKDFSAFEITASSRSGYQSDYFMTKHKKKFDYAENVEPLMASMYQEVDHNALMSNFLKPEADTIALLNYSGDLSNKFFDGQVKFAMNPELSIGFHTKLLECRSSFCKQIFHPENEGEYFVHEGIKGAYDPETRTLLFESAVEVRSVLVLLHFMYTNIVLSFWEHYPSGLKCPEEIRKVKSDFTKLMDLFRMDSLYGKQEAFVSQLRLMADDKNDGDVLVTLQGGEMLCHSSILVARSAFFETILSTRWGSSDVSESDMDGIAMKYIALENVSMMQFQIILDHLYGCNDLHVFDKARNVLADGLDSDDFVNFLLEMIEVADELLLEQLKHLCELAISEFVSTDIVLILLAHAGWLGAHKLFMGCCWYIYNNLEAIVFDGNLRHLDDELIRKLEEQIRFLQNCKSPDFVIGEKGEVSLSMDKNVLELREEAVEQFVTDIPGFNEIYMSDCKGFCSFPPLRDVKLDNASVSDSRRKLSSRRMSRKGSIDSGAEFRKAFTSQILERKASDSAVADEEEFEVVTSRKRNPKKSKLKSPDVSQQASRDGSVSPEQQQLTQGLDTAIMDRTASSNSVSSIASSSFAWVSRNSSATSVTKAPPIASIRDTNEAPAKTKIKFAPTMKLTQKQRRRLALEPRDVEFKVPTAAKNPWKVVSQPGEGSLSMVADLPVLGAKKEPKPSLNTIMLQETVRVEEQKIQDNLLHTLEEIQQEQEFAKWWEEESKKVQQEMGRSVPGTSSRGRQRRGSRRKSTAQV